ncbi:MAG: hypothetical protein BWZ10_03342 [candidate division BRC1 bacterium ADurb.BinA364]|nr:MAG: hypothetical protein BWZ10_03342 [candidate division BRC1 bacterium ADurb.BinA364]
MASRDRTPVFQAIGLIGASKQNRSRSPQRGPAFAARASGKLAQGLGVAAGIQQHQIQIAAKPKMLKAIVQNQYAAIEALDGQHSSRMAVAPDDDRSSRRQPRHQRRFVAALRRWGERSAAVRHDQRFVARRRGAVASAEDRGAEAGLFQRADDSQRHRRFACAADGQIADANDRTREAIRIKDAASIRERARRHAQPIGNGQGAHHGGQGMLRRSARFALLDYRSHGCLEAVFVVHRSTRRGWAGQERRRMPTRVAPPFCA